MYLCVCAFACMRNVKSPASRQQGHRDGSMSEFELTKSSPAWLKYKNGTALRTVLHRNTTDHARVSIGMLMPYMVCVLQNG